MVKFSFSGHVNVDGSWSFSAEATDGQDATCADVARVLSLALVHFTESPGVSIRPVVALPDGWCESLDGINVTTLDGVVTYTRTYDAIGSLDADGKQIVARAPCNADGTPNAATVAALSGA